MQSDCLIRLSIQPLYWIYALWSFFDSPSMPRGNALCTYQLNGTWFPASHGEPDAPANSNKWRSCEKHSAYKWPHNSSPKIQNGALTLRLVHMGLSMCKDVNAHVLDFFVGVLPKNSNAEMSRRNDPPYVITTTASLHRFSWNLHWTQINRYAISSALQSSHQTPGSAKIERAQPRFERGASCKIEMDPKQESLIDC
jgi:hypothetical protein